MRCLEKCDSFFEEVADLLPGQRGVPSLDPTSIAILPKFEQKRSQWSKSAKKLHLGCTEDGLLLDPDSGDVGRLQPGQMLFRPAKVDAWCRWVSIGEAPCVKGG